MAKPPPELSLDDEIDAAVRGDEDEWVGIDRASVRACVIVLIIALAAFAAALFIVAAAIKWVIA